MGAQRSSAVASRNAAASSAVQVFISGASAVFCFGRSFRSINVIGLTRMRPVRAA